VRDLTEIGIKKGDILLVHSSLKKIGYVENGPKTVLNALIEVLGSEGTLVVPTYPMKGGMYKVCQMDDYIFDYKKHKTQLGAIPREFLNFSGISRSIHPTHSISAIGKYSKKITESHHIGNKTFGENSPWAKIRELNGKILGIGINIAWTTQYHYVEDIMGDEFPVKVKIDKTYRIKCKTYQNEYIDVEVQPHDPEIAKTRIEKNSFNLNYITEIYTNLGILNYGKIGEALSWWVDVKKFFNILIKLAKLGVTIYTTEEEFKKNKLYPYKLIKDKLS
jgi:aminoglycoside N3'-acetyltransferase